MASTLLLDTELWDLVLDANGNIALASEPYSLAQDAASAIKNLSLVFGSNSPLTLLKQQLVAAAMTVPGVASAQCFIASTEDRVLTGQVQVVSAATGQTSSADFSVISPQGAA